MATHWIVCVTKNQHGHLLAVGTGTTAHKADRQWTVAQVRAALRTGDRFYTKSPSTGKTADVETFDTIRSKPDEITDNNLDNLRTCNWN